MGEFSKNSNTEGMRRKDRRRIDAARTVIHFLTDRHEVPKGTIPGSVGTVLDTFTIEPVPEPTPISQPIIERTEIAQLHGWSIDGSYR